MMLKRKLWISILGAFILLLSLSSTADDKQKKSENPFLVKPFVLPEFIAKQAKDYRNNWSRLTGFDFSGLHWNQFVMIYANKGAEIYKNNYLAYLKTYMDDEDEEDETEEGEVNAEFVPYEVGTIFIKENYLGDKGHPSQPMSLTIMIKREKGFDSANNDWEYIQSLASGEIAVRGNANDKKIAALCSDCHANMKERDYIFSTYYSESK